MENFILLPPEEQAEYEAYKIKKAKKAAKERQKNDREAYKSLVDETILAVFPELERTSVALGDQKRRVYDAFSQVLEMKQGIFEVKSDQNSHTFTSKDGDRRIILGHYIVDGYDDTVDEGIAKVKQFIQSLAKDHASQMLVDAIMKLLARDQKGSLKASRVMQLSRMAEESGDAMFIDGVRIIRESYRPAVSKTYVRAERKDGNGAWVNVPLGMTES